MTVSLPSALALSRALATVQLVGDFRDEPDRLRPWLRVGNRAADLAADQSAPAELREAARVLFDAVLWPVGPEARRAAALAVRSCLQEPAS